MTIDEAIKIYNTLIFAASFSNPQGTPLNMTKEELTEAMGMATNALEEVQQYRKNGITIENAVENMCNLICAESLIAEYRAIGTPEELQDMNNNYFEALSDWRQYRKIGTLEECRVAVEKQTAKKPTPIDYEKYANLVDNAKFLRGAYWCPNCNHVVKSGTFCNNCGQKLDWSDEE